MQIYIPTLRGNPLRLGKTMYPQHKIPLQILTISQKHAPTENNSVKNENNQQVICDENRQAHEEMQIKYVYLTFYCCFFFFFVGLLWWTKSLTQAEFKIFGNPNVINRI